jgi:hypothetical protein
MTTRADFQLAFDASQIPHYAARYTFQDDQDALEAGRRIAGGEYSRANLEKIVRWKTGGRGAVRITRNSDEEIRDALELAIIAKTDRASISVLTGVSGVHVPVASAILTAIKPESYTIIDFRALEALSYMGDYHSIEFYLSYLTFCRQLALRQQIDLRQLDRALWQWSKERK